MENLSRSERFMYYSGILAATGMNVDVNDLVHVQRLLEAEEQGLLLKLPCKRKPKTNADRIRNMTDEELAEFWESGCDEVIDCKICEEPRNEYGSCTGQCRKEYLRWLQKEVE